MSSIILLQHSRQPLNADASCTYLIKLIFAKVAFRNATGSSVVEPAVEPDHPERHDLWEPVVIARDSALTENICVGLSDCVRPETLAKHFHLWTKGGKERKEKERKVQEEEMATGSACIYVIMDPTEKSEMSRRDASTKNGRVRKYLRIHVYA